jgi:hypothetical protein
MEESAGTAAISAPHPEIAERDAGFNKTENAEVLAPGDRLDPDNMSFSISLFERVFDLFCE